MAEDIAKLLKVDMPKGQVTGQSYLTSVAPSMQRKSELQSEITAAEGEEAQAKQAQAETLSKGKLEAQQKYGQAEKGAMQEYQGKLEAEPIPAFVPTKDTAQDLAGLFSLVSVIGMVVGKQNAQQAMGAMNGMLEGYQKGRSDLYKKEAAEFDKNFKAMVKKHEEFRKEMEDAVKLASTDREAGMQAAELAATKAGSAIVQAQLRKGDLMGAYKLVDEAEKGVTKAVEIEQKTRQHAADMAQRERLHREDLAAKEKIASLKGVGGRSAINERYANTVFRSANETLRSLELMEQIGISTGGGALGSVVGKGSIPSEAQRYIGQALTEEQQKNYNTAMSGLALELAYVLNGGYKPDVSTVSKLENYLAVGPNDTAGNAAYKFSDVAAKLKAAIEVSPTYTEDQKKTKEMLAEKLDKYAAPEIVYERQYGIPKKEESAVRKSQSHPEDIQNILKKYED